MSEASKLGFSGFAAPAKGALVVFCGDKLAFGAATKRLLGQAAEFVKRAATADNFTGKAGGTLDIVAPARPSGFPAGGDGCRQGQRF